MKKKLLAMLLSVLLLMASLPLGAVPVTAAISGKTGDCIWQIDGTELTISGMGAMANYSTAPWGNRNITSVRINDGVTHIGAYAFADLVESGYLYVYVSDSVVSIGEYAFSNNSLVWIYGVPDHVLSIGRGAFENTSVSSSSGSVTKEGAHYLGKHLIKAHSNSLPSSVSISAGTLSIADYAFQDCTSITSVTIPNSVQNVGVGTFIGCRKLKSFTVDASNPNYSSKEGLLLSKDATTLIQYPGGLSGSYTTPHYVTKIGSNAFRGGSLSQVMVSSNVTSIEEYAFAECSFLTDVTIGENVTRIGEYAFYECSYLKSITIPPSVTEIGYRALSGYGSEIAVYITDMVAWCNMVSLDPFYFRDIELYLNGTQMTDLVIPDGVTAIADSAFYNCDSLTSVTIPDSVTTIGRRVFYNCDSLTSVTIPDGVTTIGDDAFYSCSSLASVTIPDSVTTIGERAFDYCDALELVTIGDSVTTIGDYAFYSCRSLASVTIPDSVTTIGNFAFSFCDSLTTVTIPDSVTTIGDDAFAYCTSLESVTIGSGVASIGERAFRSCTSLESVTIGDGVTTIGAYAFNSCGSLTSITIPDSVTTIAANAFAVTAITDVYYGGLRSRFAEMTIESGNTVLINATWHYHWNNHTYDADCDDKCDGCGEMRTPGAHVYDNACDADCNGCGLIRDVSDHVYVGEMTAATCTADGAWTYTCTECGDSYVEYVSALGHVSVTLSGYAATCVTDGLTDGAACSVCGEILTAQVIIPAMGRHLYDNACDTDCNVCGEVRQVSDHAYTGRVTTEVTCTQNGVKTYACANCGDNYTEDIPALGHVYDNEYDAACNHCGEVRGVELPEDVPAFVVDKVTTAKGETITVAIRTKNNAGIVSLKLRVAYDADVLELIAIEGKDFSDVFFSPLTNNPFIVTWTDAIHPDNTTDGVVALVTFRVKDEAAAGKTDITVTYDPEDVYNQNFDNVAFYIENGYVEIVEYTPGDTNDDGRVNNKDLGLLQQYLADWDVTMNLSAADTNADGRVNNKDLGLLQQYLAEWDVTLG